MRHEYKLKKPIHAEQFDGSDEMIKKYKIIDKSKLVPVYYRDVKWLLPTRRGLLDLWENDNQIVDLVAHKYYSEQPRVEIEVKKL